MSKASQELQKHIIYVGGALDVLAQKHFIVGATPAITDKGRRAYQDLVASGWRPDRKILAKVLGDMDVPADDKVDRLVWLVEVTGMTVLDALADAMRRDEPEDN